MPWPSLCQSPYSWALTVSTWGWLIKTVGLLKMPRTSSSEPGLLDAEHYSDKEDISLSTLTWFLRFQSGQIKSWHAFVTLWSRSTASTPNGAWSHRLELNQSAKKLSCPREDSEDSLFVWTCSGMSGKWKLYVFDSLAANDQSALLPN